MGLWPSGFGFGGPASGSITSLSSSVPVWGDPGTQVAGLGLRSLAPEERGRAVV